MALSVLCLQKKEMKFGKWLRIEVAGSLPEWQCEFLSYKDLKRQLNLIDLQYLEGKKSKKRHRIPLDHSNAEEEYLNITREEINFILLLQDELSKVNAFYMEKEEDCIIRLKELQDKVASLDLSAGITHLQKDILDFHGEMVLLLHYSVLNFTGLMKIVKKHDKRTGTLICSLFMPRVLQQPFFTTNLLYKLMQECELLLHNLNP